MLSRLAIVAWRNVGQLITGDARTPAEIREAVYLSVGDTSAKQSRFWLLLLIATGIATAGIISDSTATVIGAMIIAPLATPIQGVAVGIAFGEARPLLRSLVTLLLAIAVTVAFAALLARLLPVLEPLSRNSQVTGRVSPTIVDLVAAAFTGLAGSVAITRRDIGDILPGVAIAISLVPPLAVVGVTMDHGDWSGAVGALVLFVTNVLAIILLGVAVFSAARLRHEGPGTHRVRPAYAVVVVAGVIVSAALALSTYRTVQLFDWQQTAKRIGSQWAERHGGQLLAVRFDGSTLVFVVQGRAGGDQDPQLLALLHGHIPNGTPIDVDRLDAGLQHVGDVGDG
jgi:uncharacterized hydrophobic protein (TIGR00271 family)